MEFHLYVAHTRNYLGVMRRGRITRTSHMPSCPQCSACVDPIQCRRVSERTVLRPRHLAQSLLNLPTRDKNLPVDMIVSAVKQPGYAFLKTKILDAAYLPQLI